MVLPGPASAGTMEEAGSLEVLVSQAVKEQGTHTQPVSSLTCWPHPLAIPSQKPAGKEVRGSAGNPGLPLGVQQNR